MSKDYKGNIVLKLTGVFKTFKVGQQDLEIIKGVDFTVNKGDFLVLFGPSGCGKSTLLNILLGLEPPSKGSVEFLGDEIYKYDEDRRADIRKKQVGMVYQQSNWVKALNVIENVYFPLTLRGTSLAEREKKATDMLKRVEMDHAALQTPTELSSGQQQRISLSRALIADPALIVADEPTGNLDSKASQEIMSLFQEFNQKGHTVIMVTHDLEYLSFATRAINVSDGKIIGEYKADDKKLKDLSVSKRGHGHQLQHMNKVAGTDEAATGTAEAEKIEKNKKGAAEAEIKTAKQDLEPIVEVKADKNKISKNKDETNSEKN